LHRAFGGWELDAAWLSEKVGYEDGYAGCRNVGKPGYLQIQKELFD
jgi:hypothetical protein